MKRTASITTWLSLIVLAFVFCAPQVFAVPTVSFTSPGDRDVNVRVDSTVSVVFSEAMTSSSLTTDSFRLTQPATVVAVAAGGSHSVAIKGDGTVVAWGNNNYGQATVPAGLAGVTAVAAGGRHTVALKGDGTVVAWGNDE
jgi:hypothetical protein